MSTEPASTRHGQVLIDATMLLRWQHLAPVGIVRLERLLASHLRFRSQLGPANYVVWSRGYRPAEPHEIASLDVLLSDVTAEKPPRAAERSDGTLPTATSTRGGRALPAVRRAGLRAVAKLPSDVRPFAEQAAWSMATLGFESSRHVRRTWRERGARRDQLVELPTSSIHHRVDFSIETDLVALGLGWEYLDHEAMYRLRTEHGVRIHMPAFDLIPVATPQMNAGQSHLVHRYYAEMAHYADSITSISNATRDAMAEFLGRESLPVPHLAVNLLPGFPPERPADGSAGATHRLGDKPFVLSVSTVEIRKNHVLLAKLWTECIREGREMPMLVIVGRIGWDVNELLRWVDYAPELDGRVLILSDVEDDELVELYRAAQFTVFPSRVEGWGLPITESLTYGKVCVHSNDPAQLEASQGLMPSFHPDDFLGWKHEIVRLCDEPEYLHELEAAIGRDYRPRTTQEYCESFELILAERREAAAPR